MSKYYVVWKGRNPGVYDSLDDAMEQVNGYPGAMFKSYASPEEAATAFRRGSLSGSGGEESLRDDRMELGALLGSAASHAIPKAGQPDWFTNPAIDLRGWAVDASCLGNPGVMEYRGVELMSGREIFRVGPFDDATNNIGEFLAIVHALALMERTGETHTIYSDSVSGMAWVRNRKIKTQLSRTPRNEKVFQLMERAMAWLNTHSYKAEIRKWQTKQWGEIPADFGRK